MATKTASTKSPRVASVTFKGLSPLTQGRAFPFGASRAEDETSDEYDERMWRERAHYDAKGKCVIPASSLHKALIAAAKFRNEKIPGEGAKTWAKRFGAGIMVLDHAPITPVTTKDSIVCTIVHVPADGLPGGTKRVHRRFPIFQEWGSTVEITVVDGLISEDVFTRHMETAGKFVGLGTYRPSSPSPGTNGRFEVEAIEWKQIE